jgi:PhoD-like phosphatase
MTLVATHTFEEGTDGAAVVTGVDGIVAVSNMTYAASAKVHGTLGVRANNATGSLGYSASSSGQASFYMPGYTIGTGSDILWSLRSTATIRIRMRANPTTGKYEITDNSNVLNVSSTASLNALQAVRMDIRWVYSGGNIVVTCRMFYGANVEGTTPDETLTTSSMAIPAAIDRFYIGTTLAAGWITNIDTVRLYDDVVTWPGPLSVPVVTEVFSMSGNTRETSADVVALVANTTSVKLRYSTSSVMASPSTTIVNAPDAGGYVHFSMTGLTANTKYYYQLTNTVGGVETAFGDIGSFRTRPSASGSGTLKLAIGACVDTGAPGPIDAMANLVAWDPHTLVHLGDAYYSGNSSFTTVAQQRSKWEGQVAAVAPWKDALNKVAIEYINSDHETNPDNADTLNGLNGIESFNEMVRQTVPGIPFVKTGTNPRSKHRSWVDCNIRFIMLDIRNMDRSLGTDSDSPSKTMLGADQLAWFLSELSQPELLKVVFSDVPWSRAPTVSAANYDKWWSYSYERTVIGNYIVANDINVDMYVGDAHRLGYDDGSNNAWGGFPITVSAGFSQSAGGSQSEDYWQQWWPAIGAGSPDLSVYARVTFDWPDADHVRRTLSGWDAIANVQRVSAVTTWARDAAPETNPYVKGPGGTAVGTTLYRRSSGGAAVLLDPITVAP